MMVRQHSYGNWWLIQGFIPYAFYHFFIPRFNQLVTYSIWSALLGVYPTSICFLLAYQQNHVPSPKPYISQLPLQKGVVMWHPFGQWEANEVISRAPWKRVGTPFPLLTAWSENEMLECIRTLKRQHKLRMAERKGRKRLGFWQHVAALALYQFQKAFFMDFWLHEKKIQLLNYL